MTKMCLLFRPLNSAFLKPPEICYSVSSYLHISSFVIVFLNRPPVAQAGLKLTLQTRTTVNSGSSCLSLPSVAILDVHHYGCSSFTLFQDCDLLTPYYSVIYNLVCNLDLWHILLLLIILPEVQSKGEETHNTSEAAPHYLTLSFP